MFTPRVLIADDESSVAASFARQFRACGWQTDVTTSAKEVVALAELTRPDLIVLDVQQGHVSGVDVLRELKANARTSSIPVTMISGAPTPDMHRTCLRAGALAFLQKPMGIKSVEALREIVDARHTAPRVLFSDDDPLLIRLLERGARQHGLDPVVDTDSDGTNIVELAKSTSPAVIVLDINQKNVDGRELLAMLKADPETRHIRVVMLSGVEDQLTRHDCLILGADDYIVKPLDSLFFRRLARKIQEELQ